MRSDDAMMGDGADHGEGADVRGNGPAFAAGSPTEFTFTDKVIRTVLRDGEPWFVAADVCEVLEQPDTMKVVSRLEEDEKGAHSVRTPGGPQDLLVISESGLYALVLTSRKPQARPFQRRVTGEVIPSIRRTVIPRRSEGEERLADATVGDLEPELEALAGQGMTVFIFRDRRVRTVVRAGDPWFVAVDVCLALGIANVSQAISRLEADETTLISNEGGRGGPGLNLISESGLYVLVLTSRKPQAAPFQRWVTREVIPSIRRTGAYAIPKSEPYQRVDRGSGEPFHHAGMGTMAVSTSPGPHIGSLPSGDLTVTFADFMAFMYHGRDVPEEPGRGPDHPNEPQVLMYLAGRGRGGDCARNPLNGRWVFKMAALQDWYRNVGSIVCYQPR